MCRNEVVARCVFTCSLFLILGACRAASAETLYDQTIKSIPGLVAYWNLEDPSSTAGATAAEATGNHNGVYRGNVSLTADTPGGGSAKAADFSAGGYIDGIATTGFPAGNADRSIVFWMKSGPIAPDTEQSALEYGTADYGEACGVGLIEGSSWNPPLSGTHVFGSQYGNSVASPLADANWHMYTLMIRFGTASPQWTLWTDGANLIGNTGFPTNTVLALQAVIGSNYAGLLDSIAVYNVGLNDDAHGQMYALYQAMMVPEPSTTVLLAVGLIGLLAHAWRKRR
jgi:hypothetical protein